MEKKVKKLKNVVFTGGHAASSAFVIAQEVKRQNKPWKIYWIGFKSSLEGEKVSSLSSLYFPKYGIKTYNINAGRIQRRWSVHTIPSLLKIPVGFIHALMILSEIKPNIILSFGGFSAFPVVIIGYIMRIPVIIHEQTSVVGRSNKYSSFFAKKVAVSRETSNKYFPVGKTVLIGNPIPKDIKEQSNSYDLPDNSVILVTGGQSGAMAINNAVGEILPKLLKKHKVIHLTGIKDENKFKNLKKELESNLNENYQVYGIVDPQKYNRIFNSADILISRAGANTVSKIIASRKPSILIPLPISYLHEQEENAIFAQKYGGARIIKQSDLKPGELLNEINYLQKNWRIIFKGLVKIKNPDIDAAEKLVALLEDLIK